MNEQIGINNESIIHNQNRINKLEEAMKHASSIRMKLNDRIVDLETSLKHVLERLHQLEEKERVRARTEHNRELSLDSAARSMAFEYRRE